MIRVKQEAVLWGGSNLSPVLQSSAAPFLSLVYMAQGWSRYFHTVKTRIGGFPLLLTFLGFLSLFSPAVVSSSAFFFMPERLHIFFWRFSHLNSTVNSLQEAKSHKNWKFMPTIAHLFLVIHRFFWFLILALNLKWIYYMQVLLLWEITGFTLKGRFLLLFWLTAQWVSDFSSYGRLYSNPHRFWV